MKKNLLLILSLIVSALTVNAQSPGDTIVVPTLSYSNAYREMDVSFPNIPGVTYEKIYMMYNMRCKNGLVSPPVSGQTNIGCGEWDYTCNTYVTDSSKTDSTKEKHPSHIITGFAGNTFNFAAQPTYSYYKYTQQQVNYTATINETINTVGAGAGTTTAPFNTQYRTSKSQFLWTAAELSAAGLTSGNISSIKLNVTNAGTSAQYLKVRMKATAQTALNAVTPELTGFTEVYFLNTTLVNGVNQLRFYNNFNWDGISNILVEFSLTNPATGTNSIVTSDNTTTIKGLVSTGDDYAYALNGTNMLKVGNSGFGSFANQISIGFWCYGNPGVASTNGNSIIYATNPQGHRQANVHLPWSGATMFWDCGSGGSYDRISKIGTTSDFEGKWNYWVFTKNTSTGSMKTYLNGALWHSGSNFTLPVVITSFLLGSMPNGDNPFLGKMDEFTLWNTELQQTDIQAWMNKNITSSHPNYSNLVAYYKFNENGGTINDASANAANATLSGNGAPVWQLQYGKDIFKNFTETSNRPTVSFVKGTYTQTTTAIVNTDSVKNTPNIVYRFAAQNNNIVPIDTTIRYKAGYTYVYDGNTNAVIDSVNIPISGTINITQLDYYKRSPSSFQLVSFVTPYGINLDMGMDGKTWTFDVTDFGPVLKGNKRLFMNGGGEFQEQMDIKFLFVVGTPPRNVRGISNIWKVEAVPYDQLLNENKMEPRMITLDPASSGFKIKTAITGHGQEGEFIPRTHYININGGAPEFTWQVWKSCALNPLYPQGGTWIYDRAGWCPGMATNVQESDISSFGAGSNIQVDYGLNTASGSSNYWISNLLVNYGPANFTLNAAVIDVKNPSKKIEYARTNPICSNPVVTIQNTGSTTLTSLKIDYWTNNNTRSTYTWTGSLAFLEKADVTLPVTANLWSGLTTTGNTMYVEISAPNGGTDQYLLNDKARSGFDAANVINGEFNVVVRTNNAGAETSYEILNASGVPVLSRSGLNNNTVYVDTMRLPSGCYTFRLKDSGEDGLSFFANNDGNGYARFTRTTGSLFKTFIADFGNSIEYNFTITGGVGVPQVSNGNGVVLYPNPSKSYFNIEGTDVGKSEISIYNAIGQLIKVPSSKQSDNLVTFQSAALTPGLYNVVIRNARGNVQTIKLTKAE